MMKWEEIHDNSIRVIRFLANRLKEHNGDKDLTLDASLKRVAEHLTIRKFVEDEQSERGRYDYNEAYRRWKKQSIKRRVRRLIISGGAAACLIGLGVLVFLTVPKIKPLKQQVYCLVKPGERKAILTLSGEINIQLGKSAYLLNEKGGAVISIDSAGVVYGRSDALQLPDSIHFNTLTVPRGGEYYMILGDGTQIWMNADSRLRYPVVFGKENREVELTGEAFFEVMPDSTLPFIVKTGLGDIRVYGTEFNLKYYTEDRQIAATLVEGSISFSNDFTSETKIIPNQQLIYKKGERSVDIHEVKVQNYASWRKNLFSFENETLEEIMKTLSRWYDIDVVFEDVRLKSMMFSGNLDKYSRIETFLKFFEVGSDVNFDLKGTVVTIRKK